MATSHWPWRQARPKESVTTTAGRPGERGAQRAGRGVGVAGQQDDASGPRGVGGVDARVGAHEPVAGAADEHAALGADDLGRLVEHDLDLARVLAVSSRGQLARPRARPRRRPARRRGPRPWRRPCARRRARRPARSVAAARGGEQRGEVVAGPDLGDARAARRARSSAHRRAEAARACPRVCGAPPVARGERGAQRVEVVGVSTSSTSDGDLRHRAAAPAASAQPLVALAAARPEAAAR